ncbi:MAG: glycosyltransferase family 4 protein [Bacteroidetes bacterium]|nr:glycosyltransferase family 4 protein [Bacteroidota bacterium]
MSAHSFTVLHLVNTLEFGGVYRHIMDLATGCEARGIRNLFAAWVPEDHPLREDERFTFLPVYRGNSEDRSIVGIMRSISHLRRLLRTGRVDILHSHSRLAALLAAIAVSGIHGIRRLHTVHTNFSDLRFFPFYPQHRIVVSPGLDEAFCASQLLMRKAVVHRIHNGVALPQADENAGGDRLSEEQLALGNPDHRVEFAFIGRLVPQKGILLLLDALRLLKPGSGIVVRVYGDGPLAQQVKAAQREGLPLVPAGYEPDAFLHAGSLRALLFPSVALEGMPYVLLEAYARGIPALCHSLPALRHFIAHEHTGLIVSEMAPEAWADAMHMAATRPEDMQAMGAAGKALVGRAFRLDVMREKTVALYQHLRH